MPSETAGSVPIRRALLSVSDTRDLVDFARGLSERSVDLIATDGTRHILTEGGIPSRSAEELTGIGAWFGGRIKTLHPGLLGGILAPRTAEGVDELSRRGLVPIDLVAVNFYPFADHLNDPSGTARREEFVDIGGVTLARAAAKNHEFVAVLTDPTDYPAVLGELVELDGKLGAATRRRLAVAAFERCAEYDSIIARGLAPLAPPTEKFPGGLHFVADPLRLRYGENPHQAAAPFDLAAPPTGMRPVGLELLKGESLSYTNLLDLDTAVAIVDEFSGPAAAVVKHATPCGVAAAASIEAAVEHAVATDPVARYGCVIAMNRPVTAPTLEPLHGVFVDSLGAPAFDPAAREALQRRPKVKLVAVGPRPAGAARWLAQSALGRLLLQEADTRALEPGQINWVTGRTPTAAELAGLVFAWSVVRHAKSNAVVLAQGASTVGIGSGQPTRVKAVELAVEVAGARAKGSVLASDAFFPFADGVDAAARAGVSAILQPGGSLRDPEVIAVAAKAGIAMGFTGWRVFRH